MPLFKSVLWIGEAADGFGVPLGELKEEGSTVLNGRDQHVLDHLRISDPSSEGQNIHHVRKSVIF